MRVLTIACGVLMMATGAFCFINSGQTFLTMAFVVGAVMVVNGIVHALAHLIGRGLHNKGDNNGWILIDALLTLLLGILILCNQLVIDTAIPMVFGMWTLVSGLLRVEAASHIVREKKRTNFDAAMITGLITSVVGIFVFIGPILSWVSVIVILGMCLVVQGINAIELGINMPHENKNYVKVYRRQNDAVKIVDDIDETPEAVAKRLEQQRQKEQKEKEIEMIKDIVVEDLGVSAPAKDQR